MALPFEDQLPFEALPFEEEEQPSIQSPRQWAMSGEDDRDPAALKSDFEQMGPLRQAGEVAAGVPEALVSMASSIPAMFAGGASMGAGLLAGDTMEEAVTRGRGDMDRFTYKPRTTGGQLLTHDIGNVFHKAVEAGGSAANFLLPFEEPISRTLGEAGTEAALAVLPLGGALKGIKGARVNEARAQDVLNRRMAGESEYGAWEADAVASRKYAQDLAELDNIMLKFDKDMQAPQLGKGGRISRIPDQDGKPLNRPYVSQEAMDADLARTGRDWDSVRYNEREAARKNDILLRDRQPPEKPRLTGPMAELETPAEGAAREVRDMMRPRDKTPGDVDAVKEPGGNFHPYIVDELYDALIAPSSDSLSENWSKNLLQRYVNKYLGTSKDPLKDIEIPFFEGRERWENLTDHLISSRRAGDYNWVDQKPVWPNRQSGNYLNREEHGRIQPNDLVWNLAGTDSGAAARSAIRSYLNHVSDYAQTQVAASELSKYDFVRLVKETVEWDKKLAKAMEKKQKDSMKDATIVKEYPDGYKWIKLDKPGKFRQESDMMGHSVRGYEPSRFGGYGGIVEQGTGRQMARQHPDWIEAAGEDGHPDYGLGGWDAIKKGHASVYSLRDPQGRAHVTIETGKKGINERTLKLLWEEWKESAESHGLHPRDINVQSFHKWIEEDGRKFTDYINQIKGAQNYAPIEKYHKYVHDFIKSREWSEVRDAYNVGLETAQQRARDTLDFGLDDLNPALHNKYANDQRLLTANEFNKELQDRYSPDWQVMQAGNFEAFAVFDGSKEALRVSPHFETIDQAKDWLYTARQNAPKDVASAATKEGHIQYLEQEIAVIEDSIGILERAVNTTTSLPERNALIEMLKSAEKELLDKIKIYGILTGEGRPVPNQPVHSATSGQTYNPRLTILQKSNDSVRHQLEVIRDTSEIPYYKELAKLLLNDESFNPRFELTRTLPAGTTGRYSPGDYKVRIAELGWGEEGLLLHEAIHARVHATIELALRAPDMLTKSGVQRGTAGAVNRLQDLYVAFHDIFQTKLRDEGRIFQANTGDPHTPYGLKNIHEFVSEGFTNPEFQALLAKTELPASMQRRGFLSYWDKFVDSIGKLLGFDRSKQNFLADLIKSGTEVMQGSNKEIRRFYEKNPSRPNMQGMWDRNDEFGGYTIKDFKDELVSKGIRVSNVALKAMYEASNLQKEKVFEAHPKENIVRTIKNVPGLKKIQQQYKDARTWDEIIEESKKHPDTGMVKSNITGKILGGKFTALDHPLWSKVSSEIHDIKHRSMMAATGKLHGKSRNNPDPSTYNHTWRKLTAKEREFVNDFGWQHNNSETPVSSVDLAKLTPNQRQAYQERVKINKEVLADVNTQLAKEGKDPIPALPNYWSPIIVDDPFVVKFKDATGETKKIMGFYMDPPMKKLQKIANELGMTAEKMPERGQRGQLDFEQLDWILRHLDKEMRDPASRAITEGLRRQGFTRHGLKRKGVEGGKGSAGGRKGLRDYEETSEKYIRQAYEWISNRELDALYNKVNDEASFNNSPYAKGFALEAIDQARGGANATFEGFSKMVGDIVSGSIQIGTLGAVKLPNRFTRDLLRNGNKVATTLLLGFGNLTNIAANGLQAATYVPPQLLAMGARSGMHAGQLAASVPKAMLKASSELLKWDDSTDIKKLKQIGALEATFKYDWSTYASDADPRYSSTMKDHLTGISTLSWIESNAVRRPASLMFLNMLREIGYDSIAKSKDEIYYVAKEMTDKYMVSTRWYEKPHAFARTGLVGTAISPLQSFTTTWLGMFREYAKLSSEGLMELNLSKQAPLATFMATNILTAGILGLVGIKEWDAIATFLNKHFNYNIPTGTEWVMSKFKDQKLRFGLLSDAVGAHIGATFNAPTLTGSFAPGVSMLGNAGNFAYQQGRQVGAGMGLTSAPTSQEMRDAWKGVTPRFNWMDRASEAVGGPSSGMNWGDIEQKYTPPGAPYQDMAGNAGPVTRTPKDWQARKFGTYTLEEATEKTENYIGKRSAEERSGRLSSAMSKAADILLMNPNDPKIMEKIEPLIARMEDDQYTGKEIKQALRRELMAKLMESDDKMVGRARTSKQRYIYQLLERLR